MGLTGSTDSTQLCVTQGARSCGFKSGHGNPVRDVLAQKAGDSTRKDRRQSSPFARLRKHA